jgi:hypothetical protein
MHSHTQAMWNITATIFDSLYLVRAMLEKRLISILYPLKINVALKLRLRQNLNLVYHKFNTDFKGHVNFGNIQEMHESSSSITHLLHMRSVATDLWSADRNHM